MKYFPFIWATLWRKKTRTIFTLLSIVIAFLLYGVLQTVDYAFEHPSVGVSGADKLRGLAELGAHPGRRDLGHRLAAPHQRPSIGLDTRTRLDGHRFPGQHGLVDQDFTPGDVHIRGNNSAQ